MHDSSCMRARQQQNAGETHEIATSQREIKSPRFCFRKTFQRVLRCSDFDWIQRDSFLISAKAD
jgi:hypothetical protein